MNFFDIRCTGNRKQVTDFFRLELRIISFHADEETVVGGFLKIFRAEERMVKPWQPVQKKHTKYSSKSRE